MKRSYYLLILFLISIYACHKDNPCPNSPADFTISETNPSDDLWQNYQCDTNSGGYILFTALESNLVYEWHVGSEVYNTQQVEINFSNIPNNYVYPITLIVHKTQGAICFNNGSNTDTLTKNMTINRTDHLYYGQWQGYYIDTNTNKALNDSLNVITIKKGVFYLTPTDSDVVAAIYGIPYTDTTADGIDAYAATYKELTFFFDENSTPNAPNVYGNAIVNANNNNITIRYTYYNDTIKIIKTFKGSRL